jgi:hypothetical protein
VVDSETSGENQSRPPTLEDLLRNRLFEFTPVLTLSMMHVSIDVMMKRITANLPNDLLRDAMQATGEGITETLIRGLQYVSRSRAYDKAQSLRGKISLRIDLEESRERSSR